MRCASHPDIETSLRCGKCGKLICPKCMVQTPIGARCPDCAGLNKLPTYVVSTRYYLKAIGASLGMAMVCGAAWGAIEWVVPFFSFNLLLAPAAGYAIGEVIGISVNRKRGMGLAILAGITVVISYAITFLFPTGLPAGPFGIIYHLVALALGIFVAVSRLR